MQLHPKVSEANQLFIDGAIAFAAATHHGMRVDVEYCQKKKEYLTKKIARLERQFSETKTGRQWHHIYGTKTKYSSSQQLSHLLYKHLGLEPLKMTNSGEGGSTDKEALSSLGIPDLDLLLEMEKLKTVRDVYFEGFLREQVNGWLHAFLQLHTTRTYRPSGANPNLLNIPKRDEVQKKLVRSALYPRYGHQLLSMDFSQIEVLMACCYTKDPRLIYDAVQGDMHKDMAIELYLLDSLDKKDKGEANFRQGGKNGFVFPEFYGDYWGNCYKNLLKWAAIAALKDGTPGLVHLQDKGLIKLNEDGTIKNSDKFQKHVKEVERVFWEERYSVYTEHKDKTWSDYQQTGHVDLYTGFRCTGLMDRKQVGNYQFQGSAFHCLLWVFIQTHKFLDNIMRSRVMFQVYDELTIDCHPEETKEVAIEINRLATVALPAHWPWIIVPLKMEAEVSPVDVSWGEKEFYPLP